MTPIGGERFGVRVPQTRGPREIRDFVGWEIVGTRRGPQRAHSSMGERGPQKQGREMGCMGVEDPAGCWPVLLAARPLGDSGIQVTVAGLGCNNFGMRLDAAASARVVHAALDLGVNLFDTADVYGMGESERHLAAALKGRRDQAVVLTKFGSQADPEHPEHRGASPEHVRRAVEASLRRLETDYIDVYMLHRPDLDTPIEATLEALQRLVEEGKVRAIANSNFAGWQIADADWTSRTRGFPRFVAAENLYSLLERAVEREVLPACRRFGQ